MHDKPFTRLRTVAALSATLLGLTLAASPAVAKPGGTGTTATGSGHCVVSLDPGSSTPAAMACYRTFTEAIAAATNGVVADAPAALSESNKASVFSKIEAANRANSDEVRPQLVISVEYEGGSYGGAWSITFEGPASCTASTSDIDYQADLPEYYPGTTIRIWDAISSFQTFSNCWVDHYYLQGFGLPRTGYYGSQPSMPTMSIGGGPFSGDNNTRSIRWS